MNQQDINHINKLKKKGDEYYTLDYYNEALECYFEIIKLMPDQFIIYYNIGHIFAKQGKYKKILQYCYKNKS